MRDCMPHNFPFRTARRALVTLFLVFGNSSDLFSQWSSNPVVNTAVCINTAVKTTPEIVADGNGGVIVSWRHFPGSFNTETRAQRLTSGGTAHWDTDGVVLNTNASSWPTLGDIRSLPDKKSGAYTYWRGPGSFFYYGLSCQHVDSMGTMQWQQVGSGPAFSGSYDIAADDTGGVKVAFNFHAAPPDSFSAIYTDYLVASSTSKTLESPRLVYDGYDGTIVVWQAGDDIYGQRVAGNGTLRWPANNSMGMELTDTSGRQSCPLVVRLPAAGSAIAWYEDKNSTRYVYVQQLDSAGVLLWGSKGKSVFASDSLIDKLSMISDNAGGVIVVFQTKSVEHGMDIIAQRLDAAGVPLWGANGLVVCDAADDQTMPRMIADGFGGTIIVWQDRRSGTGTDIYAQRVTMFGVSLWGSNGVVVSNAANDQENPVVASDGVGGAIVAWEDTRNGGADIYAQIVGSNGALPVQLAGFAGTFLGNRRVRLQWRTAGEMNNFGFEVQRRSVTSTEFITLPNSFVAGHGTTLQPHDYEWTDVDASSPQVQYRLKQMDLDGMVHFSEPIAVNTTTTIADEKVVRDYALAQNYPNPFNPTTQIHFELPQSGFVTLKVFDMVGREVATLVNDPRNSGSYTVRFDATNLSSGLYVYRLSAGSYSSVKKMIVMK